MLNNEIVYVIVRIIIAIITVTCFMGTAVIMATLEPNFVESLLYLLGCCLFFIGANFLSVITVGWEETKKKMNER